MSSGNGKNIKHIKVFFTQPNGVEVEAGIVLVVPGMWSFVYKNDYNGPALDPVNLDYKRAGSRKFTNLSGTQTLHGVFRGCLPGGFGMKEFEKAFPEYRRMPDAEKLYFLGSRSHGPLRFECVEPIGVESSLRTIAELDAFRTKAVSAYLGRGADTIINKNNLYAATYYGGDRPKARFQDKKGVHWVAKFNVPPAIAKAHEAHDNYHSLARMEYASNLCMRSAGLNVVDAISDVLPDSKQDVYFSRDYAVNASKAPLLRIPMFELANEDPYKMDYLHLAKIVREVSARPNEDLEQLFARMIADRALNNSDNHAGNFEMVLQEEGWRLSPAFDVAPSPETHGVFSTSMLSNEGPPTRPFDVRFIELAASRFGLPQAKAYTIASRVIENALNINVFFDKVGANPDDAAKAINAMPRAEMASLNGVLEQKIEAERGTSIDGPGF